MTRLALRRLTLALLGLLGALAGPPARADDVDHSALRRAALAAVEAGDDHALDDVLDRLVGDDSPDTVDVLVEVAAEHPRYYPYELAVYHLAASIEDPIAVGHLAEELEGGARDERARVALADACARREDDRTALALAEAVADRDDAVALIAIRAVGQRRIVAAVEPLIHRYADLVEDRRGASVLLRATEEALHAITGEQFGSASEWESFWAARGEAFTPPSGLRGRLGSTRERPRFFETEVHSDRVVFVIDVSGSMRHGTPPRLDRVQEQLVALIDALPDRARFGIVAFSGVLQGGRLPPGTPRRGPLPPQLGGEPWLWHTGDDLLRASDRKKERAKQLVRGFQPDGYTFTLAALRYAFAIADADLIVLLSDGQPEEIDRESGQQLTEEEILREIAALNRYTRRRIDTFGIGSDGDAFLERLAEQEGGAFTSVD